MAFCFVSAILGNTIMASDSNPRNISEVLPGNISEYQHLHLNSSLKGREYSLTYSYFPCDFPYIFLHDKIIETIL